MEKNGNFRSTKYFKKLLNTAYFVFIQYLTTHYVVNLVASGRKIPLKSAVVLRRFW